MKLKQRLLSAVTAATMQLTSQVPSLSAFAADGGAGKYVSEVFIAYGKTEDEAKTWLTDHGWEPVGSDLNAGKLSYWDKNQKVAAVMGIKRTNDPNDAVTDMAVMNMNGGYSFKDYEMLVQEKQTEINAFVDTFIPVLREYRDNYNGNGSAAGKARADLAHEMLNKFYDGEIDGAYAVHDTGKPLGDLLLQETNRELGGSYDSMAKNEQVEHADITQILLESSGPAVLAVEQALVMAADTSEDTWLERLSDLSGVDLAENIEYLVPSAAGKDLSPSAAQSLLRSTYGDAAASLAAGYETVQQDLIWYESYMANNGLDQLEGEADEDYSARIDAHFDALEAQDEAFYEETFDQFYSALSMYGLLYSTPYEGEWGETLGDFFLPENGTDYGADPDNFLPFAAVLSEGQRAGLDLISLYSLLQIGAGTEEAARETLPDVQDIFGEAETISIYSGINRAIFRGGVALTSQARMQENMGRQAWYDKAYQWDGLANIVVYSMAVVGVWALASGRYLVSASEKSTLELQGALKYTKDYIAKGEQMNKNNLAAANKILADNKVLGDPTKSASWSHVEDLSLKGKYHAYRKAVGDNNLKLTEAKFSQQDTEAAIQSEARAGTIGRWFMGIGGALLVAAAAFETYQMYKFYQRDFTAIPMMIVDEADIVTYMTDENGQPILDEKGNQKKNIGFDQFAYYDVVKCNRQEVGQIGDWQDGVDEYDDWGCGDAVDLNCDCGKQWLALYTNKSPAKGDPILADSLTVQTGSDMMPASCTKGLHYFTYDYAMDIADEAYAFNNKEGGIYLFWKGDDTAYAAASAFTTGQLALTGIGGLAVGILGTTVVMMLGKKRKKEPAPTAA
ncbi:MAG: hypothetical protein IKI21_04330 [Oscillospiraceae bacterium]|nr:hypothetical protein [Oscillospiraceae bacterium]